MTEEEVIKEKSNKEKWIKIILGIVLGVAWIILISLGTSTEISVRVPLIFLGVLTGIYVLLLVFWKKVFNLFEKKDDDEIPEPITPQRAREMVVNVILENWNKPAKDISIIEYPDNINKNQIYVSKVPLEIPQRWEGNLEYPTSCIVIINATYPQEKPAFLPPYISEEEIQNRINKMSRNPRDDPNIETTEVSFDSFNRPRETTTRKIHSKETKKEEGESIV